VVWLEDILPGAETPFGADGSLASPDPLREPGAETCRLIPFNPLQLKIETNSSQTARAPKRHRTRSIPDR
jgi:hypothetical protein